MSIRYIECFTFFHVSDGLHLIEILVVVILIRSHPFFRAVFHDISHVPGGQGESGSRVPRGLSKARILVNIHYIAAAIPSKARQVARVNVI